MKKKKPTKAQLESKLYDMVRTYSNLYADYQELLQSAANFAVLIEKYDPPQAVKMITQRLKELELC